MYKQLSATSLEELEQQYPIGFVYNAKTFIRKRPYETEYELSALTQAYNCKPIKTDFDIILTGEHKRGEYKKIWYAYFPERVEDKVSSYIYDGDTMLWYAGDSDYQPVSCEFADE